VVAWVRAAEWALGVVARAWVQAVVRAVVQRSALALAPQGPR
jgi:hypothetical protein